MRIRTVKPEFWQDEDLAEISETARLVAIGLLNMADDEGFFNANEKLVSSLLFPLTEPSVSIHECLNQLVQSGYLKLYPCKKGKKVYGQVVNFLKHQKVNRPSPSKIKDLIEFTENSLNDQGGITVGKEQGAGNREQGTGIKEMEIDSQKKNESNLPAKADESKPKRFTPPLLSEVYEYMGSYAQGKGETISEQEPEKFVNFYSSKNWLVGKGKMKDWKASARNWVLNAIEYQKSRPTNKGDHQSGWSNGLLDGSEML